MRSWWKQATVVALALGSLVAISPAVYAQIDLEEMQRYHQSVNASRGNGPKLIELHCEHAVSMAAHAVKVKNPNVFNPTSGITQTFQEAEKELASLGPGHSDYTRLQQLIAESKAQVEAHHSTFQNASLSGTPMPPDAYKGADKAKLKQAVLAEWKKLYPQDKVLGVRFHMATWQRKQEKEWNGAIKQWQFYDNSVLAVSVLVQKNASVATIFPVFLNINHKKGPNVVVGAETKGDGYVHKDMLLKNVKF